MPDQVHNIDPLSGAAFIGLQSYTEAQADSFFGRDEEIEQLTKLVKSNTLTIVFGRSGTGKTSLLNAGVFPMLRKEYCLPFRIRLEFNPDSPDLITQVKNVLRSEIDKYGFEVKSYPSTETLWEYFHSEPLWKSITPILIFDQFEEIFTLAKASTRFGDKEFDHFWQELADLIENSIPEKLKDLFLNHEEDITYNHKTQKTKVLFSFREEYLPEFESITAKIPSIKLSRFRLLPMNGKQAYEVITKTWGNNINPAQADKIVTYFSKDTDKSKYTITEVEPSLLSQVCSYIEKERVLEGGKNITSELLEKYPREKILGSIYDEALSESNAALPKDPGLSKSMPWAPMNEFVEDKLITGEGYRTKYTLAEKDNALMPGIDVLEKKYFLRREDRSVELTHDVLTPLIKTDRERRRKEIAFALANKKARKKALFLLLFALLAGVAAYLFITYEAREAKNEMEAKISVLKNDSLKLNLSIDSLKKDSSKLFFSIDSLKKIWQILDTGNHNITIADTANHNTTDSGLTTLTAIDSLRSKIEVVNKLLQQARKNNDEMLFLKTEQLNDLAKRLKRSDAENNSVSGLFRNLQERFSSDSNRLENLKREFKNLQAEYYAYRLKYPVQFIPPPQKPLVPDENSLILNLNFGSSMNNPVKVPDNMEIYLIPTRSNNKLVKDIELYEIHCDEVKMRKAIGKKTANYYNGKYFFSNVAPDNYLIKVCSYYGNYKLIGKNNWKKEISMDVSPPVQ